MVLRHTVGSWGEKVNLSSRRFLKSGASERYSHSEKKSFKWADESTYLSASAFPTSPPKNQMSDNLVDPGGV